MLAATVLALTPFLASGFLHLDGYMDTSDAVLSRRPIEDKLRILKDPHPGAFGVIMLAVLFVLWFASVFVIFEKGKFFAFLIIPIVSRCCSALSILCLKTLAQSAYANMLRQNTGMTHKIFIILVAILSIVLSWFLAGVCGLIVAAAVIAGFTAAMAWAYTDLKGVSGDLAGFALVVGELCGFFAMAIL